MAIKGDINTDDAMWGAIIFVICMTVLLGGGHLIARNIDADVKEAEAKAEACGEVAENVAEVQVCLDD